MDSCSRGEEGMVLLPCIHLLNTLLQLSPDTEDYNFKELVTFHFKAFSVTY